MRSVLNHLKSKIQTHLLLILILMGIVTSYIWNVSLRDLLLGSVNPNNPNTRSYEGRINEIVQSKEFANWLSELDEVDELGGEEEC